MDRQLHNLVLGILGAQCCHSAFVSNKTAKPYNIIEQSKEKLGVETLPMINNMNTVQLSVLPFKPFKSKEFELLRSGRVRRFLTCEVQTL